MNVSLQDSLDKAKIISSNKKLDIVNDNIIDYYSEKFNCGFKLRKIDEEYILYLYLDNLPGDDIVCIKWDGTKDDYKYMLDCIEDYTIIDFISLFQSIKKLINKIGE